MNQLWSLVPIKVREGVNDTLARVVAWSLRCAGEGVYPSTGFYGEPFESNTFRHGHCGKQIANGYRFLETETCKFFLSTPKWFFFSKSVPWKFPLATCSWITGVFLNPGWSTWLSKLTWRQGGKWTYCSKITNANSVATNALLYNLSSQKPMSWATRILPRMLPIQQQLKTMMTTSEMQKSYPLGWKFLVASLKPGRLTPCIWFTWG